MNVGAEGERLARHYLETQGLTFRAANVRVLHGEIDLIMVDVLTSELVFIEVRSRRGTQYGRPEESFTARKRHALERSIAVYLTRSGWKGQYRLDVVGVLMTPLHAPVITHTKYVSLSS